MRKFTEELTNYIFENLTEQGTFAKKYSEIAVALNVTQQQARNAMLSIIKDGVLEVLVPSHKGISSNPIYKLKSHRIEAVEVNPIVYEDTKIIEWEGIQIKLTLVDSVGYCIEASDLMMCVLSDISVFDKIVKSNAELFQGHIFEIDNKIMVSRHGVLAMLMKINLDKSLPIRRRLLADFQTAVVSVMCDSQLRARLYITEQNKFKIQHNLNCLLDLDPQQVEEMLVDLELQISSTIEPYRTQIFTTTKQVERLRKNVQQLESRVDLEVRAKDLAITESRNLRSQLLERN